MNYQQAAEYLGFRDKRSVQRRVAARLITAQRIGHRTVRITKQALDNYLEKCTK